MRIHHTASVNIGIPAFSVHGALSDHHRLIRQFGAVPLMYYLFGENVIINTAERILRERSTDRALRTYQKPLEAWARSVRPKINLQLRLEIPMAVTAARNE